MSKMVRRFFWATAYVAFTFIFILVLFEFGRITFEYIHSAQKRLFIQVYLKKGLSEQEKLDIGKVIVRLAGVERVEYIAGEEAKLQFVRAYPEYEKIMDLFQKIPLPEGYRISVAATFLRSPYIDHLLKEIGMIYGVEEVAFKRAWAHKLVRMEDIMNFSAALFGLLIILGSLLIFPVVVGHTLTWKTIEIPMFGQPSGAIFAGVLSSTGLFWIVEQLILGKFPSRDIWSFALTVAIVSGIASEIVLRVYLKAYLGER